jgi:molybdopterin converting factor small subunit
VPILRLFGPAREIAGTSVDHVPGASVAEVTDAASLRYGERFSALLPSCRVWVNGDTADPDASVREEDEVAILPPVSGG